MGLAVDDTRALTAGVPLAEAEAVCVLLHGRGQSPEVMLDLAVARLRSVAVHYVLPRAPGGTWYDARAVDPLTPRTRAQLAASLDQVSRDIEGVLGLGWRADRMLLAGFSQGACLALEWVLSRGPIPAALAVLTGCRVGSDARGAQRLDGLPVYMANGDADPWIPVQNYNDAAVVLSDLGAVVEADLLVGRDHTVSQLEIDRLTGILCNIKAGRQAFDRRLQ
jgi:phospholipase/carboxylesterase